MVWLPCRRHPAQREWRGPDGRDAKRSCGQPEEHLLPRGAQGPGDASARGDHAGVHAAALPVAVAQRQHKEPAAKRRLLPTVGVLAAAAQVSEFAFLYLANFSCLVVVGYSFLSIFFLFNCCYYDLCQLVKNSNSDRASWEGLCSLYFQSQNFGINIQHDHNQGSF